MEWDIKMTPCITSVTIILDIMNLFFLFFADKGGFLRLQTFLNCK